MNRYSIIAVAGVLVGVLWFVLSSATATADCAPTNDGMATMAVKEIKLVDGNGTIHTVKSHIADDSVERAFGYQYICQGVIDRTTILFVFPRPLHSRFHMRNVKAALDIGFFDANGQLIAYRLMQPYHGAERPVYGPDTEFQYALEARAGYFAEHEWAVGTTRLIREALHD